MSHDLVVRARRVVTTAGEVARCIGVTGGTVAAIEFLPVIVLAALGGEGTDIAEVKAKLA